MFTDANSLFHILTTSSTTTAKRLILDVQTVRNAYAAHEIYNVEF